MTLKARLSQTQILLAPGMFDALTAHIAAEAGAEALYLSGAAQAYTRHGRPDIGLVSMSEVAETIALVRDRVDLPLIVDADNGFGNALNVQRTVRVFERAGATALQLEDQTLPKRCGHLSGKTLISQAEMVGKVQAACDARSSAETLIIARTDAIAVEGFDAALDRAEAYLAAGADILFIEAPKDLDEMTRIGQQFGARVPLLANMVEGGQTPIRAVSDLQELGYRLAIFPGGIVRALAAQATAFYTSLMAQGSTDAFRDRMLDFDGLNRLIGTPETLALGKRYEAKE
ncbi:MAG: isocitrate lyase/phosphoenolpyruvate mutase family protein [Pseudomonadota bacterium]